MIDLHNGDCLDVMDDLIRDGVIVDAIIADIPYGNTSITHNKVIPVADMWDRLEKLVKPDGVIVLFGAEPFASTLRQNPNYKYDWYWVKQKGANFLNFKYQPSKVVMSIMVFGQKATSFSKKGNLVYHPIMEVGEPYVVQQQSVGESVARDRKTRRNNKPVITQNTGSRYPNNVLSFNSEHGLHYAQKPVPLMEYLVKTYTKEEETVLDFAMGSGTTLVACKNLNRSGIGIEIDKAIFDLAEDRINSDVAEYIETF